MLVSDFFLIGSSAVAVAGFYYYSREKRMLREFIQQSRRHHFHKELDVVMQKKANRYLLVSILSAFVSLPLLIQKFIELYSY
jgi:hypothetical protein